MNNSWIRRSAGVAVLSAGLVGAASTAAQADEGPQPGQLGMPSSPSYSFVTDQSGDVTGGTASTTQTFDSTVNQTGLVNVAVTPNIQLGTADASATGHRQDWRFSNLDLPFGGL